MSTATSGYETVFKKMDALQGVEKKNFAKTMTPSEKKAYLDYLEEKDCQMVTGIFRCFEPLGGTLEMTCKAHPKEDPTKHTFFDGMEYTVPRYVARRFESEFQGIGTWYPSHSYIMDANGRPIPNVAKKNRRFGFSGMDFQ